MDFYKEVIEKSHHRLVVVDFSADWCMPCKMLKPVLEKLQKESDPVWDLHVIDVDRNIEIALQHKVRSLPMVLMFKKGEVVNAFTGMMTIPKILKLINDSNGIK